MEVYAAQVTAMDRGIGEIVDALKRTGRLDNTLLFFTIDNGGCHVEYGVDRKGSYLPKTTRDGRPMKPGNIPDLMPGPEETYQSYGHGWANASNTPFRLFKQYDHEGGIHTPMIAHWPRGIANPGGVAKHVSHLIDIMPTVLDATELTLPERLNDQPRVPMAGLSLLPSLQGKKQPRHEALYFSHAKGQSIRQGDWKLVKAGKEWELYDLKRDPNELHNLATENAEKVATMKSKFNAWLRASTADQR